MRSRPQSAPPGPFRGGSRYNSYGAFLRETFGCRVAKVVVDAGFSCPNRDGTLGFGGCSYCDNDAFRPATATRDDPVARQVKQGIAYLRRRYRAQKFIVYFQPFTNTFAPLRALAPLYESAFADPDVVGIAIGTRPDCLEDDKIAWLENLARTRLVTVELGLESIHDKTLARINRGHNYECWQHALRRASGRGIYLGAHLILGFPWESRAEMLGMAEAVSGIGLDFLKLHHLHVVRNTGLGRQYLSEPFPLLGYEEYLDLLVEFLELLDPAIRLERLFGLTQEQHLLAPHWGKTRAEMQHGIEQALVARATWQGRRYRTRR
jgi:radical SAM protein (TIGR01212 family)